MFGQFENRYPNNLWQEIAGNADTKLDMGATDTLTAEYFCSLMGVSTVETNSIRKSNSIEGDIGEYGQKNISTLKRNLLNSDEILRLPYCKAIAILRGHEPLLLEKVIYKEHPLAKQLKDNPISDYNPKWVKNTPEKVQVKEKIVEKQPKKEKLGFHNF